MIDKCPLQKPARHSSYPAGLESNPAGCAEQTFYNQKTCQGWKVEASFADARNQNVRRLGYIRPHSEVRILSESFMWNEESTKDPETNVLTHAIISWPSSSQNWHLHLASCADQKPEHHPRLFYSQTQDPTP